MVSVINLDKVSENSESVRNNYANSNETENDSGIYSATSVNLDLPVCLLRQTSKSSSQFRIRSPNNINGRLLSKNGRPNIVRVKIPYLWTAYIRDIGNTLVNSRWRWTLLCFASSYIMSWLLFSWFYMLIANDNNDVSKINPSATPCLVGIQAFAGYFLFSVETQHTIGYGSRYLTSNCPEGIFLISLQMIMGVALCGGMASIVYTKMIRPHKPHSTSLFSKFCVICQRDGILCLMFRVRDKDARHQIGTKINAYLVQRKDNELFLKSIQLDRPGLLLWPLEVVHKVTPNSPFWNLSARDLIAKRFELIITMNGTSTATGQCSKTRTSYLSSEILWGHRFQPCVHYDVEKQAYLIDIADFNTTEEVLTPLCSAERLSEVVQDIYSPYAPYFLKSPTMSRGGGDADSCRTSSGIESMRDEPFCSEIYNDINISNVVLRKLSTIREFNSAENLKTSGPKEKSFDVNASILAPDRVLSSSGSETPTCPSKVDKNAANPIRNSGAFDVESLISSLENYIRENPANCKEFRETPL